MAEIELYKRVIIPHQRYPRIVQVMSDYHANNEFQQACMTILDNFCGSIVDYITKYRAEEDKRTKDDKIISYLRAFEERAEDDKRTKEDKIISYLTAFEERKNMQHRGMEDRFNAMRDEINDKISNMTINVQQMMGLAMDKLNMDKVAMTLNDSLKTWMDVWLSGSKADMQVSMMTFQTQMKDEIYKYTSPIVVAQNRIIDDLKNMPSAISNTSQIGVVDKAIRDLDANVKDNIHVLKSKLTELEYTFNDSARKTLDKWMETKELGKSQQQHIMEQFKSLPLITKGVLSEALRTLESSQIVTSRALDMTQSKVNDMYHKLDTMDKSMSMKALKNDMNTMKKGMAGEKRLFDLLSNRLMMRDGYTVEQVSNIAHSCDILVKRRGHPNIRIESKAHGEHTGDKVKSKEVEKFRRDLLDMDDHGIFVSLYTGIVGMGDYELEQLPNGKFAIYLSNNNFNEDSIVSMMQLLYSIDRIVRNASEESYDKIIVSTESMMRVKDYAKEYSSKIQRAITHIKQTELHAKETISHARESMSILLEIDVEKLENILLGNKKDMNKGPSKVSAANTVQVNAVKPIVAQVNQVSTNTVQVNSVKPIVAQVNQVPTNTVQVNTVKPIVAQVNQVSANTVQVNGCITRPNKKEYMCTLCSFVTTNGGALANHKACCKKKYNINM